MAVILLQDKIYFKSKTITRNKKGTFYTCICTKEQKPIEKRSMYGIKGEMDNSIITVEAFKTQLWNKQIEIKKEI